MCIKSAGLRMEALFNWGSQVVMDLSSGQVEMEKQENHMTVTCSCVT